MLEIAKSNSETSNNSARLAAVTLAINIARLAAAALIILVIAAFFKRATLIVLIIATPLKRGAYKVAGRRGSNN